MATLVEGVEESAVDCFTLKPFNDRIHCPIISGQVKTCNKEFIFVEITELDHCTYLLKHPDRVYDIFFHVNRVIFQLQHNALDWIMNHQLFHLFVNSPEYDRDGWNFDVCEPVTTMNYTFRFGAKNWKCCCLDIFIKKKCFAKFIFRFFFTQW